MEYKRSIQSEIERQMFKGKIIIIYGARRVGKTTLIKQILREYPKHSTYLNCEIFTNKALFETTNHEEIKKNLGDKKLIVLDEAQNINNIGTTLKIIADTYPEYQIIATGSSSFELANETSEPLTGRARRFLLYPLSVQEIKDNDDLLEVNAKLNNFLRFGLYPSVINQSDTEIKEELEEIASNYLYKDILKFQKIKKSNLVLKLLQALAFQVGNEVSAHEISNLVGENYHTIERYMDLLEKCFVIFRLRSLSRNPRKEIGKKYKIYFYDLGIRNSLIQNYNQLDVRNDLGALWENFCILERMKFNNNNRKFLNTYFWKSYKGEEIDYVEEYDGKLFAYEMKWGSKKKYKCPRGFLNTYQNCDFSVVNPKNCLDFLTAEKDSAI
jgi:uncharacterized protein